MKWAIVQASDACFRMANVVEGDESYSAFSGEAENAVGWAEFRSQRRDFLIRHIGSQAPKENSVDRGIREGVGPLARGIVPGWPRGIRGRKGGSRRSKNHEDVWSKSRRSTEFHSDQSERNRAHLGEIGLKQLNTLEKIDFLYENAISFAKTQGNSCALTQIEKVTGTVISSH
jgi:hypothetical protein